MDSWDGRVRTRAYEIWLRDGKTGPAEQHWREAEDELTNERQAATKPPLADEAHRKPMKKAKSQPDDRSGRDAEASAPPAKTGRRRPARNSG
jgi:hypothetical protein